MDLGVPSQKRRKRIPIIARRIPTEPKTALTGAIHKAGTSFAKFGLRWPHPSTLVVAAACMVETRSSHEKTAWDAGCEEGYCMNSCLVFFKIKIKTSSRLVRTEPLDEGSCVQSWNVLQSCSYGNKNVQVHLFVFGVLYSTGCEPCLPS